MFSNIYVSHDTLCVCMFYFDNFLSFFICFLFLDINLGGSASEWAYAFHLKFIATEIRVYVIAKRNRKHLENHKYVRNKLYKLMKSTLKSLLVTINYYIQIHTHLWLMHISVYVEQNKKSYLKFCTFNWNSIIRTNSYW